MNNASRTVFLALLCVCCLWPPMTSAQEKEKRVKLSTLPPPVQKTVQEQSKGATIRGLSEETEKGKKVYELELSVSGHTKDMLIEPDGTVVEIEEEIPLESLPPIVKSEIERQAGKSKILKVESITKNNAIVAYEAHVMIGGKKSEIKVGSDGKLIGKGSK